jgi:predicted nuclease of restriction endonuclease-like (RecB) superfamily
LQEFLLELGNGFSFVARQRIGVYYNKYKTSKMKYRRGSGMPSNNIIFN